MVSVDPLAGDRWKSVRRLTDRPSSFAMPWFEPSPENFTALQQARVLVIGAGGLGCELLKNLALSGFQNIEVIDMDTIDITNLNRQFLFREADVGKSKAEIAAEFIKTRVSGCNVTAHNCCIEEKPASFYRQFSLVICGLDSIGARRWINSMLCDLVHKTNDGEIDTSTVIPMIDGGTEGFKGNARVIYPQMTACVDCTLDLFPPQLNFPLCTIAHTPRLPEHCVEYVKVVMWSELRPFDGATLDADDPRHIDWVLVRAVERAKSYAIRGVDRRLTSGVLKRIIPAVASTNAVVAASCALEALKLVTNVSKPIDNYLNFTQIHGAFTGVVSMEKDVNCPTCSGTSLKMNVTSSETLQNLIDRLTTKFHLRNPSLETANQKIYYISSLMPQLEEKSRKNLERPLKDLIEIGEEVLLADESLNKPISLNINFETI